MSVMILKITNLRHIEKCTIEGNLPKTFQNLVNYIYINKISVKLYTKTNYKQNTFYRKGIYFIESISSNCENIRLTKSLPKNE